MAQEMIKLTQTVQKGGCAAKVAAVELRKILGGLKFPPKTSELLIDGGNFDDASVLQLRNDLALVSTLDFFTPIVDTPRYFGAIAAANALSDVYAMGGTPKTALAILAFPTQQFDNALITEVLAGACEVLTKAECSLSGGHTIDDDTLKFGLSVSGIVHPDEIWSNQGAKVGDDIWLTKPLGTGTLTAALKKGAVTETQIQAALDGMMKINSIPQRLSHAGVPLKVIHACTDVTGFGLLGHLDHICRGSQVTCKIEFNNLPLYPGVMTSLSDGFLTKAHRSNETYTAEVVEYKGKLESHERLVLFDPQTSGGLLLFTSPEFHKEMQNLIPDAHHIGQVKEMDSKHRISVNSK